MRGKVPLLCTSLDLYAARCGVLHTFTADSDLSRDGKARTVVYAWGNAKASDVEEAARILKHDDVVVHVRDLISRFYDGAADYLEEVARDPQRQATVQRQAGLWFTTLSNEHLLEFLGLYGKGDGTAT